MAIFQAVSSWLSSYLHFYCGDFSVWHGLVRITSYKLNPEWTKRYKTTQIYSRLLNIEWEWIFVQLQYQNRFVYFQIRRLLEEKLISNRLQTTAIFFRAMKFLHSYIKSKIKTSLVMQKSIVYPSRLDCCATM